MRAYGRRASNSTEERGKCASSNTEQSSVVRRRATNHPAPASHQPPRRVGSDDDLLLAPAGYGKTTLARQWAQTLNRAIWITATPAHRDVATFAEDIASGIDRIGGDALQFVTEYVRAKSNPQRAARDIGIKLAARIDSARAQWIIVDDYQELSESAEVEDLIAVLEERTSARFLVASRLRPRWATPRRVIYGDVRELGREELAMTAEECEQMLHRKPHHARVAADAQGWPAVLGLIAALVLSVATRRRYAARPVPVPRRGALSVGWRSDARAPANSRARTGSFNRKSSGLLRHGSGFRTCSRLTILGFSQEKALVSFTPYFVSFCLSKLTEEPGAEARVRNAVVSNVRRRHWDRSLELVLRFNLLDLVDPILAASFKPLVRSGRLGSLSAFAAKVTSAPVHPPPAVEVVEAEVALHDGQLNAAIEIASRARERLPEDHALRSRLEAIIGHSSFLLAAFPVAESSFESALVFAQDDRDEAEALHGLALSKIFGERSGAKEAVQALANRRHKSPTDLARYTTAELACRRFHEGLV